jgi:hypothetical protein
MPAERQMTVLSSAVKKRVGTRQRPYDRLRFIKLVFIGDKQWRPGGQRR